MSRSQDIPMWAAALILAALVGASCGSDSAAEPTTPPTDTAAPTSPSTAPPTTELTPPTPPAPTTSTAPTSPPAPQSSVPGDDPPNDCRRLTDFDPDDNNDWLIVNDGVMGGRSNGAIELSDSMMRFTGSVVTAGGGFTSVRLPLAGTELAESTRVELRVRPDQRTYGLTLEDNAQVGRRGVSHQADLSIGDDVDADGWTTVAVSYDELRPSVIGQPVDAPPFDSAEAREFGIIIADGVDGEFALDIDWIDACR